MLRPCLLAISLLVLLPFIGCGGGQVGSTTPAVSNPQPSVTMSFDKASVASGEPARLTWTSSNVTSCAASNAWSDAHPTSGTVTVVNVAPGDYGFKLTCTGSYGAASANGNVTVTDAKAQVNVPLPGARAACTSDCYYIDANSGSDQNDGRTSSTAFKTLQKAADTVGPGATVTVASGTYTDASTSPLVITTSGTSSAWIRFVAGAGQHPVIQIANAEGAWFGIKISASYIVIDGFEVIGQNQNITSQQGHAGNGAQALLNENCIGIDGSSAAQIPHDIVVRNSMVHDCSEAGIGVNVADAVTIAYNTVYNNSWWTSYDSSGISLYHLTDAPGSSTTNGYKNFVVGNTVYNNYNNIPFISITPPGITDGNGIIVDDSRHTQNALGPHDVKGIPYTGRTYLANNVVFGNGGRGVHAYSSSHVDMVNNTTYNDLLTDSQYISMEIDAQDCYDTNVVNNIAVSLNGKQASQSDGGTYWNNLWDGANVPMLGTNGLKQDPAFTDAAANDFTPAAGSPALDSGTAALAPAIDISGKARPATTVDRGAIQVSQ